MRRGAKPKFPSAFALALVACTRAASFAVGEEPPTASTHVAAPSSPPVEDAAELDATSQVEARSLATPAPVAAKPTLLAPEAIDGPHQSLLLEPGRPVYFALPKTLADAGAPLRLVAHLHGMCGPPSYACGKWLGAGAAAGVLVCPTGNARCGDSPVGPPSWEADTWAQLLDVMDGDLEKAIAKVAAKRPGSFDRTASVLTGYSRGAHAAVPIARKHPGRWPLLVLIEADVPVSAKALRAAGVRAVAFVGGEQGLEIAGERRSAEQLAAEGFPARLFVMRKTGHLYSDDMESVMRDALAFVVSHEHDEAPPR